MDERGHVLAVDVDDGDGPAVGLGRQGDRAPVGVGPAVVLLEPVRDAQRRVAQREGQRLPQVGRGVRAQLDHEVAHPGPGQAGVEDAEEEREGASPIAAKASRRRLANAPHW